MTRAEFKKKFNASLEGLNLKGFNPVLLLALASYESGDGMGTLAINGNNIFSLQAPKSWKGKVQIQKSTGNAFRTYANYAEAITDFINLLVGWPSNYATATAAARAGNMAAFGAALQKGGYGDPGKATYASELQARYKAFV